MDPALRPGHIRGEVQPPGQVRGEWAPALHAMPDVRGRCLSFLQAGTSVQPGTFICCSNQRERDPLTRDGHSGAAVARWQRSASVSGAALTKNGLGSDLRTLSVIFKITVFKKINLRVFPMILLCW